MGLPPGERDVPQEWGAWQSLELMEQGCFSNNCRAQAVALSFVICKVGAEDFEALSFWS